MIFMARVGVSFGGRILLVGFPPGTPRNQLVPVSTLMLGTKSSHPTQFFFLEFHCEIRLAHQAMPDQINTMPDMRWGRHERQIHISNLAPFRCGRVGRPIAFSYAVLHVY